MSKTYTGNSDICQDMAEYSSSSEPCKLGHMTRGERIKQRLNTLGMSAYRLAKLMGVKPQSVYDWLKDKGPDRDRMQILASCLKCSPEWLEFGLGVISLGGESLASENIETYSKGLSVTDGPSLRGNTPLISWVQAGDWCSISDYSGGVEDFFPSPAHCGPHTYALRVRGQSMEPRFHDGEIIFVDPDRTADHGSFVVVRLDDQSEATFKQLIIEPGGNKYLRPLNPDWPEKVIPINGNATICGRVIGKWESF